MLFGIVVYIIFINVILKLSEAHDDLCDYAETKADAIKLQRLANVKSKALTLITILMTNFQLLSVIAHIKLINVKLPKLVLNIKFGLDYFFDLDMFQMMTAPDCFVPDMEWGAAWILNLLPIVVGLVFFFSVGLCGSLWPNCMNPPAVRGLSSENSRLYWQSTGRRAFSTFFMLNGELSREIQVLSRQSHVKPSI